MNQKLNNTEERLKLVLEASNQGFWDWDIATGDIHLSPRYIELLGYHAKEIEVYVYPSFLEKVLHPEDRSRVLGLLNEHLEGYTPVYEAEYRMLSKSGNWTWILDRGKVVRRDENGKPLRAAGTHTDITDRKIKENLLKDHIAFQGVLVALRSVWTDESEDVIIHTFLSSIIKEYGFPMAWFGRYVSKTIYPVMYAGYGEHYLENLILDIKEPESPDAQCAMSRAILEKIPFGYSNLAIDEGFAKWRDYALELNYHSNLALPLIVDGHVEGGIMIYSRYSGDFPKERVKRLYFLIRELAIILTEHRHRIKCADILKYRLELEKLVSNISTRFINVNLNDVDREINSALKTIAQFVTVDRSYIYLFSPDLTSIKYGYEWKSRKTSKLIGLSLKDYTWSVNKLKNGEILHIPKISDLPQDAAPEKEFFISMGLKSILAIPMCFNKSLMGLFGFSMISKEKTWNNDDINLIKLTGEIFVNIFERKRSEKLLYDSKKEKEIILNGLEEVVVIYIDPEMRLIWVNEAGRKLLGNSDDVSGKYCYNVFCKKNKPCRECPVMKAFQSGEVREYEIKGPDGRIWLARSNPIKDENGKCISVIQVSFNITRRKQMEEELRQSKEQAEQLNKRLEEAINSANLLTIEATLANIAKSNFLAVMSHEIRTPLNGIIGMLHILSNSSLTKEQKEYIEIARLSSDSLLTVLNDILDFSKIEAGKMELENISFNLGRFLSDTINMIRVKADEKGLKLSCKISPDIPLNLKGDPIRLRQVIINLLSNSIKFTNEGRITLSIILVKDYNNQVNLRFMVQDTGIGIPEKHIKYLFKSFTQADASISRKYGGTGLGLVISKRIVDLMGGEIGVDSKEGEGATFWFTCILDKQTEGKNILSDKDVSPGKSLKKNKGDINILLAEDYPINQKVILIILQNKGYKGEVAFNGKEVLKALEEKSYDLILMDMEMPVMSGLEATKIIREREKSTGKHIPIIALTAYAMKGDREKCLNAGMDSYVSKPIDPQELFNAIEEQLFSEPSTVKKGPLKKSVVSKSVFNKHVLLANLDGDEELLEDIVNEFIESLPGQMEKLKAGYNNNDIEVVRAQGHVIKGGASHVGAGIMRRISYKIEMEGRKGDLSRVSSLIVELEKAIEKFKSRWRLSLGNGGVDKLGKYS